MGAESSAGGLYTALTVNSGGRLPLPILTEAI
jgi:hypothetical protein